MLLNRIFNVSEVPDDVFGLRDTVSQTLWHVCDSLWHVCDRFVTNVWLKSILEALLYGYDVSRMFLMNWWGSSINFRNVLGTERWCHKHCDMFVTDLRTWILKTRLHQGYVWSFWSIGRYLISVWRCSQTMFWALEEIIVASFVTL